MSDWKEKQEATEEEDVPFREFGCSVKIVVVLAMTLLIVGAVSIVFSLYFFGIAGVLSLFGIQYESTWALLLYTLIILVFGFFIELFSKALFYLLTQNVYDQLKLAAIFLIIDTLFTWFVLYIVDEWMDSVTLPLHTEWALAFLLALFEVVFGKEIYKKENEDAA